MNGNNEMSGALPDLLGLDVGLVHKHAYSTNNQIDVETEEKIKAIAGSLDSAKFSLTTGIIALGRIMWRAASLDDDKFEDGQRMLSDMGGLIEELGQLLYQVDFNHCNAQFVLRSALEYRLKVKKGGVQ